MGNVQKEQVVEFYKGRIYQTEKMIYKLREIQLNYGHLLMNYDNITAEIDVNRGEIEMFEKTIELITGEKVEKKLKEEHKDKLIGAWKRSDNVIAFRISGDDLPSGK